ncbi:MAG: hypothetical protein GX206_11945 [Clostridiales bacterium]|nr:hypothetical protein [Clostridiales bacterium]
MKSIQYDNPVDTPGYEHYFDRQGSISKFVRLLDEKGFILQEGTIRYIDILKLASEGKADTCLANNAGVPMPFIFCRQHRTKVLAQVRDRQRVIILVISIIIHLT